MAIYVLSLHVIYNCSAFGFSYFCISFSFERKSERIERNFKTQNPNLSIVSAPNVLFLKSSFSHFFLHFLVILFDITLRFWSLYSVKIVSSNIWSLLTSKMESSPVSASSSSPKKYKAKLQKEGFFPHPFICQRHFINEKVGNRRN